MILIACIALVGCVAGVLLQVDTMWMEQHNRALDRDDYLAAIDLHLRQSREVQR